MKKIRFVVGVLKEDMELHDIKTIPVDSDKDSEFACDLYKKITGKGELYPVYAIAKIDDKGLDIYDDALYYVESNPELKDLLYSLVQ